MEIDMPHGVYFFLKWDHLMDTYSSHYTFLFVQNNFQKYIKVITIVKPMICVSLLLTE